MLEDEELKNKWQEFKSGIQNIWGPLDNEDLERTRGNTKQIINLIHDRYGETKSGIKKKLKKFIASFEKFSDSYRNEKGISSYHRRPNV